DGTGNTTHVLRTLGGKSERSVRGCSYFGMPFGSREEQTVFFQTDSSHAPVLRWFFTDRIDTICPQLFSFSVLFLRSFEWITQ
ncbi:MAG: hypothetical protein VYA11_02375, partial [Planctomycetota bacterium]|nr:hypothetical protein [Planctomycetota bacterium]